MIPIGFAVIMIIVILTGIVSRATMPGKVDPVLYKPLLNTIAKGESKGNYNAYFGHADNTDTLFTDMSVDDVLKWQEAYVNEGSVSSAVGKYQIIRPTLAGLVRQLKIDTSLKFDEKLQDRLAIALLERRGSQAYADEKISREEFAANLAKEWAALPKITGSHPDESYYAGDGVNKARISVNEVYSALAVLRK